MQISYKQYRFDFPDEVNPLWFQLIIEDPKNFKKMIIENDILFCKKRFGGWNKAFLCIISVELVGYLISYMLFEQLYIPGILTFLAFFVYLISGDFYSKLSFKSMIAKKKRWVNYLIYLANMSFNKENFAYRYRNRDEFKGEIEKLTKWEKLFNQ